MCFLGATIDCRRQGGVCGRVQNACVEEWSGKRAKEERRGQRTYLVTVARTWVLESEGVESAQKWWYWPPCQAVHRYE